MSERMNVRQASAPDYSDDCYLLLDGLNMDVPFTAYTHDDHPTIVPLFRGTRHAKVIEASPWLVKPSAGGQLLAKPETWQDYGLVLRSAAGKDTIADHLRSLISVLLPSRQLAYCRFYAPTWADRLFSTMRPEEFESWSGPISQWLLHDGSAWKAYVSTANGKPRGLNEEGWYLLREEQLSQWQTDEHERFIDKATHHLGCNQGHAGYLNQREHIAALIKKAHDYGFRLEHQTLHYLELAWRFPQELSSPYWAEYLGDQTHTADQRLAFSEQQLFGLNKDV
ncbi:DUF4123 domain-containing protein [Halopseudomonas salina]|uniref:DUF4123 domain-containing protein n=1 Tax=Halopseudomonas salina TaxID=1323744 RepID=A0ABQ1PVD6_9GAMM|nr:DUF4123 domain-containing protein [Halopseudomonas salina]GGD04598.1 hypothetical protein GCM10007418_24560 [Halopseudomonas salina]